MPIEPPAGSASPVNVARHLLDERDELGQPLGLEPGRSLAPAKPRLDRRGVGQRRASDLRFAHRDPVEQPDAGGRPWPSTAGSRAPSSHPLPGGTIPSPSPGRYPPTARALEPGGELPGRVAEAGSDFDRHGPRIRPAVGDSTEVGGAVDVQNGLRVSRDVNIHT